MLAAPVQGGMGQYVRKYKNVKASSKQLQKLDKYNHLIEYFSSFAYFKARHKVNPDFMRALILSESNANPQALSKKYAKGLAQIMNETGKIAARDLSRRNFNFRYVSKAKLRNLQPRDLYDPAVNILLACYLISKYNHDFNGKLDLVVAAWNAGAGSIKNNRPPQYKETLNLIGKVNGYFVYFMRQRQKGVRYAAYRR